MIKIALDDTKVKEMLKGKEYKVHSTGMWLEENRTYPDATIYAGEDNWTRITMIDVLVDLDKKNVVDIVERPIGPVILKGATEGREEAIGIALDSEIVKEKMGGKQCIVTARQRLIEKRLLVDVYIEIEEPKMTIIATVDLKEGKVLKISEK